jgi:hypothetical protein
MFVLHIDYCFLANYSCSFLVRVGNRNILKFACKETISTLLKEQFHSFVSDHKNIKCTNILGSDNLKSS